jgi:hypothetical protein
MAKKEKTGPGRPLKLKVDEAFLQSVRDMAAVGLTNYQIANNVGVAVGTWCEYKLKYPEIEEAISVGTSDGIRQVCNALFQNATEKMNVAAQVFFLKNKAGWQDSPTAEVKTETQRIEIVHLSADE